MAEDGRWRRLPAAARRAAVGVRGPAAPARCGGATPASTRTSPSRCTRTRSAACTAGTRRCACGRRSPATSTPTSTSTSSKARARVPQVAGARRGPPTGDTAPADLAVPPGQACARRLRAAGRRAHPRLPARRTSRPGGGSTRTAWPISSTGRLPRCGARSAEPGPGREDPRHAPRPRRAGGDHGRPGADPAGARLRRGRRHAPDRRALRGCAAAARRGAVRLLALPADRARWRSRAC